MPCGRRRSARIKRILERTRPKFFLFALHARSRLNADTISLIGKKLFQSEMEHKRVTTIKVDFRRCHSPYEEIVRECHEDEAAYRAAWNDPELRDYLKPDSFETNTRELVSMGFCEKRVHAVLQNEGTNDLSRLVAVLLN